MYASSARGYAHLLIQKLGVEKLTPAADSTTLTYKLRPTNRLPFYGFTRIRVGE